MWAYPLESSSSLSTNDGPPLALFFTNVIDYIRKERSLVTLLSDPRTVRSRAALISAATELIDERDVASISITDVCTVAGVSRPTFYQHFGDVSTLVQAAAIDRLQQVFDATIALEVRDEPPVMLQNGVGRLVRGLAQHAPFYRRVLEGTSIFAAHAMVVDYVAERLKAFIERSGVANAEAITFRIRFLAAGATWLVIEQFGDNPDPDGLDAAATRIAQQLAQSMAEGELA